MSKLKISYKLKSAKSEVSPVLMMLNFGYKEFDAIKKKYSYKPLKYYTGISVNTKDWDFNDQLPLNKTTLSKLLNIEGTAKSVFEYLLLEQKKITPQLLKDELDYKLKGKQEVDERVHIASYIREVLLKNDSRSTGTLRYFKGLAVKLEDFEKKAGRKLFAKDIDEKLYLDFTEYLQNRLNRVNSVWSVLKTLKAVLNEIERKYKIPVFKPATQLAAKDKVSIVTEEKVFFSFDHIQKIIDYQPKNEKFRNVKGILLTLLFTGCRYSDVFKIKPEFEYNKEELQFTYARYVASKTNTDIIVPILKPLKGFYSENEGLPYKISDVKFNKYVKDLIELIEIDDEVTLSYTDSYGKKQYESKPFYKFVTSHIGRRSFVTNFINYIPVTILSKISGHKLTDKNVIFAYNKISLEENAALFVKEIMRQSEAGIFKIELI